MHRKTMASLRAIATLTFLAIPLGKPKARGAGLPSGAIFGISEGVHHELPELNMMSNASGRDIMKGKNSGEVAVDARCRIS